MRGAETIRSRSIWSGSEPWFFLLVGAVCLWILLLPIFPTQDGPMHRYYVHVLRSLLAHQSTYSVYKVRHPLPPYLTQYAIMLTLFRVLPYDLAERVFACLLVVCLAYGLRMSAKQAGSRGGWVTLLVAPLLLAWPLMAGFFNFVFGVAIFLFCTAWWQKMRTGGWRAFVAYVLLVLLLMVTHPVPLLLLIIVTAMDLAAALLLNAGVRVGQRLQQQGRRVGAFALTLAAAAFPALAVDSTKAQSTLDHFGFHANFLRTSLLLAGISPYNTRSFSVWINLYRLTLYAILATALWLGWRNFISSVRARRPGFGAVMFLATFVLMVLLPVTPNTVNGSEFFTTRLVSVLWLGALLGASAGLAPDLRSRRRWVGAGLVCCLITLVAAQIYIRPIAWRLRHVEMQPLPKGVPGVLLLNPMLDGYTRFHEQLDFDPMKWGAVLAVVHANDVVLDSPWTDQKITPIEAVPGGPELIADISYSAILQPTAPNAPAVKGRSLPAWGEAKMVREAGFLLLSGPPATLTHGLANQLTPQEAAEFTCQEAHFWTLLCVRRSLPSGAGS